jgi:hypothetical protein
MKKKNFYNKYFNFMLSICCLMIVILACGICGNLENNEKEVVELNTKIEESEYEKGLRYLAEGKYIFAKNRFSEVPKTDSNYADAQEKIKICDEYLKEGNKKFVQKDQIEKKYTNMFEKTGQAIHEKQSKLIRNGFKEYNSGYEEAPDGSQQIAMYYSKNEDGYTIHVRLQYSYAIDSHYAKVWIE